MSEKILKKIMYVEDDDDISEIAKIALADMGGYEVQICNSGKEAIEQVHSFNPDLFIIDVMMPNMDGPATLKALREIKGFANTPVIFMTAKSQPNVMKHFLSLGALDVISKPFDPILLAGMVKNIWYKYHGK